MASATLVMSIVASGPITNETASEVLVNSISGCQKMLDSNLLELGKIMMDQQSSLGVIEKKKQQIRGLTRLLKDFKNMQVVDFIE